MSTLIIYESPTVSHGELLQIITSDMSRAELWINFQLPILCDKRNIKFPIPYINLRENGVSTIKVEFHPQTSQDQILELIGQLNQFYVKDCSIQEVLLDMPSVQTLQLYGLLP